MAGAGRVLVRRAIVLGVALILIVILTGVIMEATGYAEKVWLAIINAQVRAYTTRLREKARGGYIITEIGQPVKENMSVAEKRVLPSGSGYIKYSADAPVSVVRSGNMYYYPSEISVSLVNQTISVNATGNYTKVYTVSMVIVMTRPDGLSITLYNGTVKPTNIQVISNDTAYAIIKASQNPGVIIKNLTDYYYKRYRDELLKYVDNETAARELVKVAVQRTWPKLLYSNAELNVTVETRGEKKVVTAQFTNIEPMNGTYRVEATVVFEKAPRELRPAEYAVLTVGAPAKIESLSDLQRKYRDELFKRYGLDKPWWVRVIPLVQRTLVFDLGETNKQAVAQVAGVPTPASVGQIILMCLPRTIVMVTIAEIICMLIALPLAPRIAYHYGSWLDRAVVTYAAVMSAIPVWWLGMVFIYLFAYRYRIFPASGMEVVKIINSFWDNPWGNLVTLAYYSALPIITIVITFLGGWFYSIRAVVLKIIKEDFVTVAKAKGLPENIIARRYILRVVAPPITTYVILALAGSLGGFIITESVFNWPGMGSLYYAAITSGDVATILGLTYVFTLIYVIARFILEVLYILLDPRVRL